MPNPWEEIPLEVYEAHMSLPGVAQLQALERLTEARLAAYPARTVMIWGVAGGTGFAAIDPAEVDHVTGVDVNAAYLESCRSRYPALADRLTLLRADLRFPAELPRAGLLIADLFIEYIGIGAFCSRIRECLPDTLCCVIQRSAEEAFVSPSPYAESFAGIGALHTDIEEGELTVALLGSGYGPLYREEVRLPNGKRLVRLDYTRMPDEPDFAEPRKIRNRARARKGPIQGG